MGQRVSFFPPAGPEQLLELPDGAAEVMPGVRWGLAEAAFSPAYWKSQAWMRPAGPPQQQRLGRSFAEETAACVLGGYGIPAEVGLAAFVRLRDAGLLCPDAPPSADTLWEQLRAPLFVSGRPVRYRFAHQKALALAGCLPLLADGALDIGTDREVRERLLTLPGVGLKTASWTVRNWRGSDEVAILDVHLWRAGRLMGLFRPDHTPARHYREMEALFLEFCRQLDAAPAHLDALIWFDLKTARRLPHDLLAALERQEQQRGHQAEHLLTSPA